MFTLINPLLKENRTTLTPQAKKQRIIYFAVSALFFVLSSFLMFDFMYQICNMLGSVVSGTPSQAIVVLKRIIPQLVLTVGLVYANIYLRCAYKATNEKNRINAFKYNGYVCGVLGVITVLYVLIGVIAKQYYSLVEGHPSPLYPLDIALGGALLIAQGVLSVLYAEKLKTTPSELPYGGLRNKYLRWVDYFFYGVAYLFILFSFASLCYAPFIMNFSQGGIFFNIMMIFVHITAIFEFIFYVFAYNEALPELKKDIQRKYSLIILAVNVLVLILYTVALQIAPYAPNNNAFGLLPIEYTASVNVFPILYSLVTVLAPLAAFLKSLIKTK